MVEKFDEETLAKYKGVKLMKLLYKAGYTGVFQEKIQAGGYAHPEW
ncbi:MAG: hypothetical protein HDQ96_13870 [Lachnospiraceae bacterium]|nr:hypothetical protein [Lachnospiraceae bacterium]